MSATFRFSGPRHIGSFCFGVGGLGVLGGDIPATGLHGPSIMYPGITLPAEANDEFMYRVVTRPPALTLFNYDDFGRVTAEGPDGVHPGVYELKQNGAVVGQDAFYVMIGTSGQASGNVALDSAAASGSLGSAPPASLAGAVTLDGVAPTGSMAPAGPSGIAGGLQLDDAAPSGTVQGYIEPTAVFGPRVVAWDGSWTPKKLVPLDVAEVDDVGFSFGKGLLPGEKVLGYVCTAEARQGIDLNPTPLRMGLPGKFGSDCMQRVSGLLAVPDVTYLLRCIATLDSGRTLLATAYLKVVRKW